MGIVSNNTYHIYDDEKQAGSPGATPTTQKPEQNDCVGFERKNGKAAAGQQRNDAETPQTANLELPGVRNRKIFSQLIFGETFVKNIDPGLLSVCTEQLKILSLQHLLTIRLQQGDMEMAPASLAKKAQFIQQIDMCIYCKLVEEGMRNYKSLNPDIHDVLEAPFPLTQLTGISRGALCTRKISFGYDLVLLHGVISETLEHALCPFPSCWRMIVQIPSKMMNQVNKNASQVCPQLPRELPKLNLNTTEGRSQKLPPRIPRQRPCAYRESTPAVLVNDQNDTGEQDAEYAFTNKRCPARFRTDNSAAIMPAMETQQLGEDRTSIDDFSSSYVTAPPEMQRGRSFAEAAEEYSADSRQSRVASARKSLDMARSASRDEIRKKIKEAGHCLLDIFVDVNKGLLQICSTRPPKQDIFFYLSTDWVNCQTHPSSGASSQINTLSCDVYEISPECSLERFMRPVDTAAAVRAELGDRVKARNTSMPPRILDGPKSTLADNEVLSKTPADILADKLADKLAAAADAKRSEDDTQENDADSVSIRVPDGNKTAALKTLCQGYSAQELVKKYSIISERNTDVADLENISSSVPSRKKQAKVSAAASGSQDTHTTQNDPHSKKNEKMPSSTIDQPKSTQAGMLGGPKIPTRRSSTIHSVRDSGSQSRDVIRAASKRCPLQLKTSGSLDSTSPVPARLHIPHRHSSRHSSESLSERSTKPIANQNRTSRNDGIPKSARCVGDTRSMINCVAKVSSSTSHENQVNKYGRVRDEIERLNRRISPPKSSKMDEARRKANPPHRIRSATYNSRLQPIDNVAENINDSSIEARTHDRVVVRESLCNYQQSKTDQPRLSVTHMVLSEFIPTKHATKPLSLPTTQGLLTLHSRTSLSSRKTEGDLQSTENTSGAPKLPAPYLEKLRGSAVESSTESQSLRSIGMRGRSAIDCFGTSISEDSASVDKKPSRKVGARIVIFYQLLQVQSRPASSGHVSKSQVEPQKRSSRKSGRPLRLSSTVSTTPTNASEANTPDRRNPLRWVSGARTLMSTVFNTLADK